MMKIQELSPTLLYRDRDIAVAVKPVGMPSQPDPSGDLDMTTSLALLLGASAVYPVHRLDRLTGGVMVYALTEKGAASLSRAFREHTAKKTYLAVADGILDTPEGEMRDYLYHDARKNRSYVVKTPRKGVKEAVLTYRLVSLFPADKGGSSLETIPSSPPTENKPSLAEIAAASGLSGDIAPLFPNSVPAFSALAPLFQRPIALYAVELETGRTHQVRIQFASRKAPLLGDGKYGSRENRCTIALWAYSLNFSHPRSKKAMSFTASPPYDRFPWSSFGNALPLGNGKDGAL